MKCESLDYMSSCSRSEALHHIHSAQYIEQYILERYIQEYIVTQPYDQTNTPHYYRSGKLPTLKVPYSATHQQLQSCSTLARGAQVEVLRRSVA